MENVKRGISYVFNVKVLEDKTYFRHLHTNLFSIPIASIDTAEWKKLSGLFNKGELFREMVIKEIESKLEIVCSDYYDIWKNNYLYNLAYYFGIKEEGKFLKFDAQTRIYEIIDRNNCKVKFV